MMIEATPTYDFIALGEALVDFISTDVADSLAEAHHFERFVGGQATNLAMNMAKLGSQAAIANCVGNDGHGNFIKEQIEQAGVLTIFIQTTREAPTTIVTITRQTQTPDFSIHRGADAYLHSTQELLDAVTSSRIIHTSAFALSREPARTTILNAIKRAKEKGAKISFDPNYHPDIWPDTFKFLEILEDLYQYVDITKPSLDDCMRLFGPRNSPKDYAETFLGWGAKIVLISLGERGVILATHDGDFYKLHATPDIDVVDVTGAGDAYWAGYLHACLDGKTALEAACTGQALAEIKISQVGPISNVPSWEALYQRAKNIKHDRLSPDLSSLQN